MRAAVLLLWASCLYMLARSVLCLLLTASPWRRLAVLAVLALSRSRLLPQPGRNEEKSPINLLHSAPVL